MSISDVDRRDPAVTDPPRFGTYEHATIVWARITKANKRGPWPEIKQFWSRRHADWRYAVVFEGDL